MIFVTIADQLDHYFSSNAIQIRQITNATNPKRVLHICYCQICLLLLWAVGIEHRLCVGWKWYMIYNLFRLFAEQLKFSSKRRECCLFTLHKTNLNRNFSIAWHVPMSEPFHFTESKSINFISLYHNSFAGESIFFVWFIVSSFISSKKINYKWKIDKSNKTSLKSRNSRNSLDGSIEFNVINNRNRSTSLIVQVCNEK